MSWNLSSNIERERTSRGLTQEQAAKSLGISRQTYINIESGTKDPKAKELEKLAALFDTTVASFFDEPRNNEKFKQMYLFALNLFKSGVPKTKLAKLLYLADFRSYYEYSTPISGVRYIRRDYGPVPDIFFELTENLFDAGKIDITPLDGGALMIKSLSYRPVDNLLTKKEKDSIKEICELWKDRRTKEIVNFTHEQKPWLECRDGEYIPYSLIKAEDKDHIYKPVG